jgi:glycosyltransferase involved in cell wall biosynthesis
MTKSSANCSFSLVLICQTYFPVLGGSEIEAQRVCSSLIHRGHRVTVVCAGGGPMPPVQDWVDPQGVPVRIYARRKDGTFKNIIYALRVAGWLMTERNNYQFVYFLMQGLHLAIGLPIARLLKKPILMKIAGSGEVLRMSQSRIGRLELRWLVRWATRILILNEGMRQEAIDHGIPPHLLLLMPNPVDPNEFSRPSPNEETVLRERYRIPQAAPVVMYCGRLAPEKGLQTLLNAFAIVLNATPDAILVLVGEGPLRVALTEQATQLGLSEQNIRFTGRVDPGDVSQWLKIATLFTLVSPSEGFPCALEEAMSTGIASVVTDIPGNRQLVEDGVHSILTPVGDAKKTADSISLLLRDNVLRGRMGLAARAQILEHCATNRVVDLYEEVFASLFTN